MKTLKFTQDLAQQILTGEKTSTWRLFDDKDLQEGDELVFLNKETNETFGTAIVTSLHRKTLGSLEEADWIGHERDTPRRKRCIGHSGSITETESNRIRKSRYSRSDLPHSNNPEAEYGSVIY